MRWYETVLGQFNPAIGANSRSVKTTIYITKGDFIHSLLSKYAAFDLGIIQITASNTALYINIYHIKEATTQDSRTATTTTTGTTSGTRHCHSPQPPASIAVNVITHLTYEQMATRLTPVTVSKARVHSLQTYTQHESYASRTTTRRYSTESADRSSDKLNYS